MWVLRRAEEYDFERFKKEELSMPRVKANNITMNYDQQGSGEPLILIPYLAADHACYAFQVAEYAKHFTCISLDLRGTGETETTEGAYSTELLADDVWRAQVKFRKMGGSHQYAQEKGWKRGNGASCEDCPTGVRMRKESFTGFWTRDFWRMWDFRLELSRL